MKEFRENFCKKNCNFAEKKRTIMALKGTPID
jgi:hypothetical protein